MLYKSFCDFQNPAWAPPALPPKENALFAKSLRQPVEINHA